MTSDIEDDTSRDDDPVARVRTRRRLLRLFAGVVIVLGLVTWGIVANLPQAPEYIEDAFVLEQAEVSLLQDGVPVGRAQIGDGVVEIAGVPGELHPVSEPLLNDLDGDGDEDIAAIVEWRSTEREPYQSWQAVFFWLWEDGEVELVEWPAAWQWSCVVEENIDIGFSIVQTRPYGVMVDRFGHNLCGDDVMDIPYDGRTVARMEKGFPVQKYQEEYTFAVESCTGGRPALDMSGWDLITLSDNTKPVILPFDGAPPVRGPANVDIATRFEVLDIEPSQEYLDLHNGYVPAIVYWQPWTGCGWVEWSAVEAAREAAD